MPSENKPHQESPGSTDELPRREFSFRQRVALSQERAFIQWIKDSHPSIYEKLSSSSISVSLTLKDVLPVLLKQLDNQDPVERQIALQLIYKATTTDGGYSFYWPVPKTLEKDIIKGVLRCLRESNLTVRREAVRTLRGFRPYSYQSSLTDARCEFALDDSFVKALANDGVKNPDTEISKTAIEVLGYIGTDLRSFAVPSLISALSHDDDTVCQLASDTLRDLGRDSVGAVPHLVELAISDRSDNVRVAAVNGVLKIAGHETAVELFRQKGTSLQSLIDLLRTKGEAFRQLRYDLQAPMDGPIRPDKFAFKGVVYEGLRGKAYKLVEYLWKARFRTATNAELAIEVWGDDKLELDHNDLGSARSKANTFFKENSLPLPFRIKLSDNCQDATLVDLRLTGNPNDC
jgi:hypothetical protein